MNVNTQQHLSRGAVASVAYVCCCGKVIFLRDHYLNAPHAPLSSQPAGIVFSPVFFLEICTPACTGESVATISFHYGPA